MKKTRRILALTGAALLLCMYACTLIFALIDSPAAFGLFQASIAATILIPVLLYGYLLIARLLRERSGDSDSAVSSASADDLQNPDTSSEHTR